MRKKLSKRKITKNAEEQQCGSCHLRFGRNKDNRSWFIRGAAGGYPICGQCLSRNKKLPVPFQSLELGPQSDLISGVDLSGR